MALTLLMVFGYGAAALGVLVALLYLLPPIHHAWVLHRLRKVLERLTRLTDGVAPRRRRKNSNKPGPRTRIKWKGDKKWKK